MLSGRPSLHKATSPCGLPHQPPQKSSSVVWLLCSRQQEKSYRGTCPSSCFGSVSKDDPLARRMVFFLGSLGLFTGTSKKETSHTPNTPRVFQHRSQMPSSNSTHGFSWLPQANVPDGKTTSPHGLRKLWKSHMTISQETKIQLNIKLLLQSSKHRLWAWSQTQTSFPSHRTSVVLDGDQVESWCLVEKNVQAPNFLHLNVIQPDPSPGLKYSRSNAFHKRA